MYVYNYTLCSIGKIFIVYTKLSILFAMYNNLHLIFFLLKNYSTQRSHLSFSRSSANCSRAGISWGLRREVMVTIGSTT